MVVKVGPHDRRPEAKIGWRCRSFGEENSAALVQNEAFPEILLVWQGRLLTCAKKRRTMLKRRGVFKAMGIQTIKRCVASRCVSTSNTRVTEVTVQSEDTMLALINSGSEKPQT